MGQRRLRVAVRLARVGLHLTYGMEVAHVTASAETLRRRLEGRGREGPADIGRRLARAWEFAVPEGAPCFEVNNDGDLAAAGRALLDHLLNPASHPAKTIA